ncbi:MAG: hypothetical protein H6838_12930 [Planctomycetes bacterium]|nr:hypothetical protein [Planctomycetota bacterium]MCB9886392.1 hypothetical protein [Planctomycetota bacterium]
MPRPLPILIRALAVLAIGVAAAGQDPQEALRRAILAKQTEIYRQVHGRAVEATQVLERENPRIDALRPQSHDLANQLRELERERVRALDEMRRGEFCSQCNRPASQIERETGKSFRDHLTEVNGHAVASEQLIRKKDDEYQGKIDALRRRLDKVDAELRERIARRDQAISSAWGIIDGFGTAARDTDNQHRYNQSSRQLQANSARANRDASTGAAKRAQQDYEAADRAHAARWPAGTDYKRLPLAELDEIRRSMDQLDRLRNAAMRALDGVARESRNVERIEQDIQTADETFAATVTERAEFVAHVNELASRTNNRPCWWEPCFAPRAANAPAAVATLPRDPIVAGKQQLGALAGDPRDPAPRQQAFAAQAEAHAGLRQVLHTKVTDLLQRSLLAEALRRVNTPKAALPLQRLADNLQELGDRAKTLAHRYATTGKTTEGDLSDEQRIEEDLFRKGNAAMGWNPRRALREFGDRGFHAPGLVGDRILEEFKTVGTGQEKREK